MTIEKHRIEHLNDHLDQFLTKTGAKDIESYFKSDDAMSYEAVCSMLDIDSLPTAAEIAAQEKAHFDALAFEAMTARHHRKAAAHDLYCPNHSTVMPHLAGKSMGTDPNAKIESLKSAREALQDIIKHLDAAIIEYEGASQQ